MSEKFDRRAGKALVVLLLVAVFLLGFWASRSQDEPTPTTTTTTVVESPPVEVTPVTPPATTTQDAYCDGFKAGVATATNVLKQKGEQPPSTPPSCAGEPSGNEPYISWCEGSVVGYVSTLIPHFGPPPTRFYEESFKGCMDNELWKLFGWSPGAETF